MFERLSTGWELAKQSVRVLQLDKELLVFRAIQFTASQSQGFQGFLFKKGDGPGGPTQP